MSMPRRVPLRAESRSVGPEETLFIELLRTADALQQGEIALLREHELTFAQYNVLRILRGAGPDGLPSSEIAQRMINRDSDMTRLLDRLEERRLVARERDTADRRVVTARLAADGAALLRALDAPVARLHRQQLAHLSERERRTLTELLVRARERGA